LSLLVFFDNLLSPFADVLQQLFRIISVRAAHRKEHMARAVRNTKIDSRSARTRLVIRREPYWTVISVGCAIGYRRGASGGTWVARLRDETGKQHYEALGAADDARDPDNLTVFSFPQAQALARLFFERRARELAGEMAPLSGPFFVANAIDRYSEYYCRRGGKEPDKIASVAKNYILDDLGSIPVAKLTKGRIEKWLQDIASSPARVRTSVGKPQRFRQPVNTRDGQRQRQATANRVLTILKAALNHAYREGLVVHDDAWRRVKAFRSVDAARVQYLTDEECRRLINTCEPDFRKLTIAALMTGCRYGELIALTVDDFIADVGHLRVRFSKSGKTRHVALTQEGTSFFLQETAGRNGEELLFRKANGYGWKRAEQQRPFLAACEAASLNSVCFHGLRHTYASRLIMKGAPLAVVAAQLGHADTRMVEKHYGHLGPSYIADTVRNAYSPIGIGQFDNIVPFTATGSG
jgi:integrase